MRFPLMLLIDKLRNQQRWKLNLRRSAGGGYRNQAKILDTKALVYKFNDMLCINYLAAE